MADNAPLYRVILDAFSAAKRQFRLHLRPDDLLAQGRWPKASPSLETLQQLLGQLVEWGNLQSQPDTARVATIEDFYRKRLLYRMTSGGEAVEAGLQAFVDALARRAELQSVALDDIRARLISLGQIMRETPPDAAKAHGALRDLVHVFEGLADKRRGLHGRPHAHPRIAARRSRCRDELQDPAHRLPAAFHRRPGHPLEPDRGVAR